MINHPYLPRRDNETCLLACWAIAGLIGGCAAPKAITTSSGFLADSSRLTPDSDKKSATYLAPGFALKNYGRITFAPVQVRLSQTLLEQSTLNSNQQQELAVFIADQLNQAFSREFHGQGNGSLKIRSAVSGVSSSSDDLAVYQYLPITLAVTAAMEVGGVRGADLGKIGTGKLKDDPVKAIQPLLQKWVDTLVVEFSSKLK